ncbi:helix-turn-helix domain-containing protein [soil metagenome]
MDDDIARAERARQGNPYLNTAQAAHFLGLSARTLQRLRGRREGPIPRRHARMVQYHIDDLLAWSRSRMDAEAP